MENIQQFALIVFAFIGVAVTLVVTIIALVWLTCFMVRLLVKTFSYRVDVSVDVAKEDIDNKAKAKKLRNKLKRDTKDQHKMTVLKMKIDSSNRVFEMKKEALQKSLAEKELREREKLGLAPLQEDDVIEAKEEPKNKESKIEKEEKTKDMDVVEK